MQIKYSILLRNLYNLEFIHYEKHNHILIFKNQGCMRQKCL